MSPNNPISIEAPLIKTQPGAGAAADPAAASPIVCASANPPQSCIKSRYRTLNGSCNNIQNPLLGVANTR